MPRQEKVLPTADGECPTSVFTPSTGTGPWSAVIIYMDGFGIRPVLLDMGQRLADAGFLVLLPDLFYRAGAYEPPDPQEVFASGDVRAKLAPLMSSTDNRLAAQDTASFLKYLDSRDDVAGPKIGATGYCMGGGVSLTVAATYPDRVAAAASFHGGGLATDAELSPHLMVDKIRGRIYIGAADDDKEPRG